MHRENSCLHDSNVLRGAYIAAAAYCALHTHTHTHIFCLLDLYSLVGTLIAIIAHIICLHARIHVYVVCTHCCSIKLKETFVLGRCIIYRYAYRYMHIYTYYNNGGMQFLLGRLSVGFVFFYFIFTIVLFSGFFFSSAPRKVVCIINYNTADGGLPGPN